MKKAKLKLQGAECNLGGERALQLGEERLPMHVYLHSAFILQLVSQWFFPVPQDWVMYKQASLIPRSQTLCQRFLSREKKPLWDLSIDTTSI